MPAQILATIDEAAAREAETRSSLLARAMLSYVERQSNNTMLAFRVKDSE